MHTFIILLLLAASLVLWLVLALPFADMKVYIDGIASDGNVERFVPERYAAAQWKGRIIASVLPLLAGIIFFSSKRAKRKKQGWSGLRSDINEALKGILKRSSRVHLGAVLIVILAGALLRGRLLSLPIMYDEAFTYTYFASKPVWVILSDYLYPNNHILHTLFVKLSTTIFGQGLIQVRLPAFIAGVCSMPLFYFFVRAAFNRHIALMALALIAGVGGLVEFSALARGYSLTWCFMLLGLLLARNVIKRDNLFAATLLGFVLALGMWTIPTMIYQALMVYIVVVFMLLTKYENSLKDRLRTVLISVVVFLVSTALFYSPVVIMNTIDQLLYHPTMGENSWNGLVTSGQERFLEILYYWMYTSNQLVVFVSVIGIIYAGFVSSKFRVLLFSTALAIVPLLLLQKVIGPPRIWNYVLFICCIGIAIALFYALKFVQDKVVSGFTKRIRTLVAAGVLFVIFGGLSYLTIDSRKSYYRYAEAPRLVELMKGSTDENSLVFADFPWKAPLEFHMLASGFGNEELFRTPQAGATIFVVMAPAKNQTIASVLKHYNLKEQDVVLNKEPYFVGKQVELYRGTMKKQ